LFRGKLLSFLKQSYRRSELCFAAKISDLSTPRAFYCLWRAGQPPFYIVPGKFIILANFGQRGLFFEGRTTF
jgi:hypothetical protein